MIDSLNSWRCNFLGDLTGRALQKSLVSIVIILFAHHEKLPALPKARLQTANLCDMILTSSDGQLSLRTRKVFEFLGQELDRRDREALDGLFSKLDRTRQAIIRKARRASETPVTSPRIIDHFPSDVRELLTWRTETSMTLSRAKKGGDVENALRNFERAALFTFDLAQRSAEVTVQSIQSINGLHRFGRPVPAALRQTAVGIGDIRLEMIPPEDVGPALQALLLWYQSESDRTESEKTQNKRRHPIELAARFYQFFISIHPLEDANGRTGRDLMDSILLSHGWSPAIFSGPSIEQSAVSWRQLTPRNRGATSGGASHLEPMPPAEIIKIVAHAVGTSLSKIEEVLN